MLILGRNLYTFLEAKRVKNKCTCKPGEIYCIRCRAPKAPAGNMVDYEPLTEAQGNLIGICPGCGILIYRRVSLAKLEQIRGQLDIAMPEALPHINESAHLPVNSDLKQEASDD